MVAASSSLIKVVTKVSLNGREIHGLINSGSSERYIHPRVTEHYSLQAYHSNSTVSVILVLLLVAKTGHCLETLQVNGHDYKVFLGILPECCAVIDSSQDFQKFHDCVTLSYGRKSPPLVICGLSTLFIQPSALSANIKLDCHPLATKSRHYSYIDCKFIRQEIQRLLEESIIEWQT